VTIAPLPRSRGDPSLSRVPRRWIIGEALLLGLVGLLCLWWSGGSDEQPATAPPLPARPPQETRPLVVRFTDAAANALLVDWLGQVTLMIEVVPKDDFESAVPAPYFQDDLVNGHSELTFDLPSSGEWRLRFTATRASGGSKRFEPASGPFIVGTVGTATTLRAGAELSIDVSFSVAELTDLLADLERGR